MSLHGLRHVLHRAVDRRVFDLEPVVGVPANQEPHVLLPVELLLEHLQHEGEACTGGGCMTSETCHTRNWLLTLNSC